MSNEFNLFNDISASVIIKKKLLDSVYAQHMYAALCNNQFQKNDTFAILRGDQWSASWRSVGRFISTIRGINESYQDFYCSGIFDMNGITLEDLKQSEQKPEGYISDEIKKDLADIDWWPVNYDERTLLE